MRRTFALVNQPTVYTINLHFIWFSNNIMQGYYTIAIHKLLWAAVQNDHTEKNAFSVWTRTWIPQLLLCSSLPGESMTGTFVYKYGDNSFPIMIHHSWSPMNLLFRDILIIPVPIPVEDRDLCCHDRVRYTYSTCANTFDQRKNVTVYIHNNTQSIITHRPYWQNQETRFEFRKPSKLADSKSIIRFWQLRNKETVLHWGNS